MKQTPPLRSGHDHALFAQRYPILHDNTGLDGGICAKTNTARRFAWPALGRRAARKGTSSSSSSSTRSNDSDDASDRQQTVRDWRRNLDTGFRNTILPSAS